MSLATIKNRRIFASSGGSGGGTDPADKARITLLENNEYKVAYFTEINSNTGTITKPAGSEILLDQFPGAIDAYVSTIDSGQPTGENPVTSGGVLVDVTSFDTSGDYTLTGVPSSYPVALIYIIKIPAISWSNLTTDNILEYEKANAEFLDNQFTLKDNVDQTKKIQFELSGITTATTRTLTSPNASGTIALVSSWVDWSSSLNPTGFSSTTILKSQYKLVDDNIIYFEAEVTGTSNATTFTITLPFALSNTLLTGNMAYVIYIVNNGTAASGVAVIATGATTVDIYRDVAASAFTASGTKAVRFQFFYRK